MKRLTKTLCVLLAASSGLLATSAVTGRVLDPRGNVVPGAAVRLEARAGYRAETVTDAEGRYTLGAVPDGEYQLKVEAPGLAGVEQSIVLAGESAARDVQLSQLAVQRQSIVITAKVVEPEVDLRNSEVFNRTLFTRDDQVLQQLNAGIDAGQHEGGGKSLEIRRFGFNLDHGGVNGGLKVMVDGVQQNQATQGHGQGYLGALKALSPELIEEVTITNGPFSAEYGDFSGLGVVQIHQRESLPDAFTVRLQGGEYDTGRAFLAYSPGAPRVDAYLAYEGSYTDGPFQNPLRYRRDNVNGNYTVSLDKNTKLGFRILVGRNNFDSSGQIPLDLVADGQLDRFGYVDPSDGGRVGMGTFSTYFSKTLANGDAFKADAFVTRSLFDLYSDFTFFLRDPVHGDAIQQHDSRLQQGLNAQYIHTHRLGTAMAVFTAGANLHDSGIDVGLYRDKDRVPLGVALRAHARVTNAAGYAQESLSLLHDRLLLGGGLRYDDFRFDVADWVTPANGGIETAGRWQGKGNAAFTPWRAIPLTLHANYGRGINSADARAVVQQPTEPRVATTDFFQAGTSTSFKSVSLATDVFLIDHSNEQVYVPDDGSFEFKGPSRAYGYEVKASVALGRRASLSGGLTKIANAFYLGTDPRVYVDSAPHFVADAALTVAAWRGWSGSLRMRAINHYRLVGDDASVVASGHTVFDLGLARQIHRGVELNLSVDNLTNRDYYETQNYFESQVAPDAPPVWRIHGTPGYPLSAVVGVTFRLPGR
jgi:outer membrane receptor protein involved in Fe transport